MPEPKKPDAGSRFAERRSSQRFAFVALIEITEPLTQSHTSGHVSEISQHGCFIEAERLLAVQAVVQLRIHREGDVFETWARVAHIRSEAEMGLHFIDTSSEQAKVLAGWLEKLK